MNIIESIRTILESSINDTKNKKLTAATTGAVGAGTGLLGYHAGKLNWRGGMKDEIQYRISQLKDRIHIPSEMSNVITKARKVKDVLMN